MDIALNTPTVEELPEAVSALREWQEVGTPMQLHPGDLGWFWRLGAERTASAVRVWRRVGTASSGHGIDGDEHGVLAVGLLDGEDLVRVGIDPRHQQDAELATRLAQDLADPDRGVLGAGRIAVETPVGALLHDVLGERGWGTDDPWAVLRRDLGDPVEDPGVRIEAVGPDQAAEWSTVVRASFGHADALTHRWHAMAAGPAFEDGRCLLARDADGTAVAGVAVWAAGPGRYGVLEPMGVHPDHRGRGLGRAVTVAAAAALRELGAAAALVATPAANGGGVRTYASAGFEELPLRYDRSRDPV